MGSETESVKASGLVCAKECARVCVMACETGLQRNPDLRLLMVFACELVSASSTGLL